MSLYHELDDDGNHIHEYGPVEESRFAGTFHRKCTVQGCRFISLDLSDDELDDNDDE